MKTKNNNASELVYSSDFSKDPKSSKPKLQNSSKKIEEISPNKITAVLRVEKSGRKGKTVTVVDKLPKNEDFLKNLCTNLKTKCGSGGTYLLDGKDGIVEIQGDKREQIRAALEKDGIKVKG